MRAQVDAAKEVRACGRVFVFVCARVCVCVCTCMLSVSKNERLARLPLIENKGK